MTIFIDLNPFCVKNSTVTKCTKITPEKAVKTFSHLLNLTKNQSSISTSK